MIRADVGAVIICIITRDIVLGAFWIIHTPPGRIRARSYNLFVWYIQKLPIAV